MFNWLNLGRKKQEAAAVADIQHMLNEAYQQGRLQELISSDIAAVADRHDVTLGQRARREFQDVYGDFLAFFLRDRHLSQGEIDNLAHLKNILGLNDRKIEQIHDSIVRQIYRRHVADVIADGQLDPAERDFLRRLQQDLQLPDDLVQEIYTRTALDYLDEALQEAIADERLSDAEERDLQTIASNLGINLTPDPPTRRLLNRYRLLWLIENGPLPELDVEVKLYPNESCHMALDVDWYEYRPERANPLPDNGNFETRTTAGIYWKDVPASFKNIKDKDDYELLASGELYVTNHRLVFLPKSGPLVIIRLSRILGFAAYHDGVALRKPGRATFIGFDRQIDLFAMILARVIADATR
jgi:hypothetical protein